ncbi:MAG: hypothetical protein QNK03_04180 [Myxococcota bacterium]|nr:hypothetical protein [Myxococcota bacterium]
MDLVLVSLKVCGVALFTLFIPITAVSFFRFRLKKKEEDFDRILAALGLAGDPKRVLLPSVGSEYSPRAYLLPVAFASILYLVCSVLLMFGGNLFAAAESSSESNLIPLLSGMRFLDQIDAAGMAVQKQSLVVITFAFLGAFIWSAQTILRRVTTIDLAPGTYYGAGVRVLLASFVALMLSFLLRIEVGGGGIPSTDYMPVIAFLTGMFPDQALAYLRDRIKIFSPGRGSADPLPLEMIEGIGAFQRYRLGEAGIDNAQNLAEANVIELILKTPFSGQALIDWIAQAKLYVYFKSGIVRLRQVGIRTVFDLKHVLERKERIKDVANEIAVNVSRDPATPGGSWEQTPTELSLSLVYDRIEADGEIEILERFRDSLSLQRANAGR